MKQALRTIFCMLAATVLVGQSAFAAIPTDDILDMFNLNNIFYYNPNGSEDACGSTSTKLTGDSLEEKIWNFYIDQGFTDAQVAGILGNAKVESGLEPTRASNSTFFGLFQWGYGRKAALVNKLAAAGLEKYTSSEYWPSGAYKKIPEDDLDKILTIELEFSIEENSFNWIAEVKKQTTVEAAAEAFLAIFERAVGGNSPILYYEPYKGLLYQGTAMRRDFAKQFYDKYAGKGTSTGKTSGVENGSNLTVFGDSITVASTNAILEQFPELTAADIHAKNGRRWDEAINVAKDVEIKDNIIFALGANSMHLTKKDIEEAIETLGSDKNIVFVTDWSTEFEFESNNNLFFEYAKNNSNIVVADWKEIVKGKADIYFYDIIHPNATGAKLFAQTLYDAVNGNSNSQGCSISGDFASLVKSYAWPEWHNAPFTNRMPAYANAVSRSISEGRYVGGSINGVPGIDCGGFVTILVQNSGIEPHYNDTKGATETQENWARAHNWTLLNGSPNRQIDTSILQPGDVAFSNGHTFIYVGDIPGFQSKIASASYGQSAARAPMAGREDLVRANGSPVRWYRNPKFSAHSGMNYRNNLQNKVWSSR